MKYAYTKKELMEEMSILRNTFDFVNAVDPVSCLISQTGLPGIDPSVCQKGCIGMMDCQFRCLNCISMRAVLHQRSYMKYEISRSGEIFHIISRYIEVDGAPMALALGKNLMPEMSENPGQLDELRETIAATNRQIMTDPLTHVLNKTYIEEHFISLLEASSLSGTLFYTAVVRLNHLDSLAAKYGALAERGVLCAASSHMKNYLAHDRRITLTRASHECFLIFCQQGSYETFTGRMNELCDSISRLSVLFQGEILHFTASCGCCDYSSEDYASPYVPIQRIYSKLRKEAR